MLPYKGSTIINHCLQNALNANCNIIVVAGYRGEELRANIPEDEHIKIVSNPGFRTGMVSSIIKGLKYVNASHFFITHADMPLIPVQVFEDLATKRSNQILFPEFENKTGHPVLIPRQFMGIFSGDRTGKGMKAILKQYPYKSLPVKARSIHIDIDTPEAYRKLLDQSI